MGMLRDRLAFGLGDRSASLRGSGTPVDEVISRLRETGSPARLLAESGLSSVDLISAIAQTALGDDDSPGPALVQCKPGARSLPLLRSIDESAWVAVFPAAPHRARLCLAAGLLQIHDFWDASHDAAQQADDLGEKSFSTYWHGIAHRREPDAGNAAYWFRRVGKHPICAPLAEEARPLLDQHGDGQLTDRLLSGGAWNTTAMIELCTRAKSGTPGESVLRRLQRLEMWLLLEATFASIAS